MPFCYWPICKLMSDAQNHVLKIKHDVIEVPAVIAYISVYVSKTLNIIVACLDETYIEGFNK